MGSGLDSQTSSCTGSAVPSGRRRSRSSRVQTTRSRYCRLWLGTKQLSSGLLRQRQASGLTRMEEQSNGIPDVLDEAKWGLDWIHKLHPAPDQLFHQVADDRDHRGFKLPDQDIADYGWGPNSYRPVYFANGKLQGLRDRKSVV